MEYTPDPEDYSDFSQFQYSRANPRNRLLYRQALDLVPDGIILDMATRKIEVTDGNACVVGWVLREQVAAMVEIRAEEVVNAQIPLWAPSVSLALALCSEEIPQMAAHLFGGTQEQWDTLYLGAMFDTPMVEAAFARRLGQALERAG